MKTSIDIPDSLYRQAKIRALQNGQTFRELLVGALEQALFPSSPPVSQPATKPKRSHHKVDDQGIPVLKRDSKNGTVITNEFVNDLREREGI